MKKIKAEVTEPTRVVPIEEVQPLKIGSAFISYCIKQGWIVQEGKGINAKYFVTGPGREALEEFDIDV